MNLILDDAEEVNIKKKSKKSLGQNLLKRCNTTAITSFTRRAHQWNVEVFGNLFARKRRVLTRLNGVQKALANNPSDFLVQLEKQLTKEYSLIMLQEEEF